MGLTVHSGGGGDGFTLLYSGVCTANVRAGLMPLAVDASTALHCRQG